MKREAETTNYALSYDDVQIEQMYSNIIHRRDVDLTSNLTKNIKLHLPVVSSNMDTITETDMAIAMAKNGGIGILHRFCSVADQVAMVLKIKRNINYIINDPHLITKNDTIANIKKLSNHYNVRTFPVIESVENTTLVGMITIDELLPNDNISIIADFMTPIEKLVIAKSDIKMEAAILLFQKNSNCRKIPLVNSSGELSGLITRKDLALFVKQQHIMTLDNKLRLRCGAAIGVNGDYLERATALINAEVDVIVIDVAHGFHELVKSAISEIRKINKTIEIIAGNVCTPEGCKFLIQAGADAIKIGVGCGSICSTRLMTGCGVPQLTAVMECAKIAKQYGIPIIADGGHMGKIGNMFKALAIGKANCCMLGNYLAGTTETPGKILVQGNKKVKIIRGMAGYTANWEKTLSDNNFTPEGVEGTVAYKGDVKDILNQIRGGMSSGMSYCGCNNVNELLTKQIPFRIITANGVKESGIHDIN